MIHRVLPGFSAEEDVAEEADAADQAAEGVGLDVAPEADQELALEHVAVERAAPRHRR